MMDIGRVVAVFKRHAYITLHTPQRIIDLIFWPGVDLLLWGFFTLYVLRQGSSLPLPVGFILGGVLLWSLLFRANVEIGIAFMDEIWSRNAVGILASPVRPGEYLAGALMWGLAKLALSWLGMAVMASLLFSFNVNRLGLPLVVFAGALMIFGVALALVVLGLILRFGSGMEILVWWLAGIIMPVSAVYYPVAILPGWAQAIAALLPPAYVFEGMRAVLAGRPAPWGNLAAALVLDAVYLAGALAFARAMFATLRRRGFVTRYT